MHTAHIDYVMGTWEYTECYVVTIVDRDGSKVSGTRFYTDDHQTGPSAADWARRWIAARYPDADIIEG